ncbi:hypothetical protein ACRRTK_009317 [Alexandromys fortis]
MRRFSVLRGCPSCSPLTPGRNPPYLMVWGKPLSCQCCQVYSARENSSVRRQDAHNIPRATDLDSSPRRQYDFGKFPTSKTARIPPPRRDPILFTTGPLRVAEAEDLPTWRRLPCPKTTEVRTKEEFKKGRKEEKKRMCEGKEKEGEEEEEEELGKEEQEAVEEAKKEKDEEKKREEKEVKENKKRSLWMLEETEGQGNKKRRMPSSHMQRPTSRTFGDKVEMISMRQTCRSQEENRHPQDIPPHVEATALVCPRKNSPDFGCLSSHGSNGDNSTGAPGSPGIPVPVQKQLGKRKAPKLELLLPPSGPLPCSALLQQLWDQGDLPPPPKIRRIDTEKASYITKNTNGQSIQISDEVDALQPMNQMVSVHTASQPALSSPPPASGPTGFLSLSTDGVSSPGPPASTPLLCQAAGPLNLLVPSPSLTPNVPTIPISSSALPSDLLPPCRARPSEETPPDAKKDPVDLATALASTTSHSPRSGAEPLSFSSPSCRMESPVPMCITDSPSPPLPATSLAPSLRNPPTVFSTTASCACEDMSWELSLEPAVMDMDTTPPSEAAVLSSPTVSSDHTLPFAPRHGCMQQRLAENATLSTGPLVPKIPCYTHVGNNLHTPRPTNGWKQGVSPSGDLAILIQNGLVPVLPPTVAISPPCAAEDFEFMDTTPPSKAAVLPSSTAVEHVSNSWPPPTVWGPTIAYNYPRGTPQSTIAYNYPRGTPQSTIAYNYTRGTPQFTIAYNYTRGTPQSTIAYNYPRGTPQSTIAYNYPRGTPQSTIAYNYPRGTPQSTIAYNYPRGTPQSTIAYNYPRGTPQSTIAYNCPRGTPQSTHALLNGPQSDVCVSIRNLSTSIAAIDLGSLAGQPAGGSTTPRQYASSKPPAHRGRPIGTGRASGKHL